MLEIECLPQGEVKRSYSAYIDFENFRRLHEKKDRAYPKDLENLLQETRTNLGASLAERANAEIYRATYTLKNGQLYHGDIPFIDLIKHGQKIRQNSGSNQVEREQAEISSFDRVQTEFANGVISKDAKIIVITPRKGIYQHNFYDVYSKDSEGNIQMRRFSSKSTYREFSQAAGEIDPFTNLPSLPADSDFISSPLITYKSDEEIHSLMQRDETTTSLEDLENYFENITPLILDYLNYLAYSNNLDWETVKEKYNAIVNGFDIASGRNRFMTGNSRANFIETINDPMRFFAASQHLSRQKVEPVAAGCGISSGYNNHAYSAPQSVTDFAHEDQYGTLRIDCKKCNRSYNRTPGKLEEKCKYCGGTEGIVC